MIADKQIQVACIGTASLPLESLTPYNMHIKERKESDTAALARKIIRKGFSFPMFIWWRPDTQQNLILDGNGRYLALQWLQKKKYVIPSSIPVIRVEAEDDMQARKKVLELCNWNGKIEQNALRLFVENLHIDVSEYVIPYTDNDMLQAIQSDRVGFFPPDAKGENKPSQVREPSAKSDKPEKPVPTVGGTGERQTTAKCPYCGKDHAVSY